MPVLCVPSADTKPWPTLGPEICDWIEEHLVFGPGDLKGEPYRIEDEFRAQIYRAYEVYPRGHRMAGKRRFKRVALEERKGTAKTERAAILAAAESHPDAPVRCDGFRRQGSVWVPVGRSVRDPYIPMVAYTEEQTEELAFGALLVILGESSVADDYDIGLERIVVLDSRGKAAGKITALAGSPNARDGARTTFQHFDETHRFTLQSLRNAHRTMLANIPKRPLSDPWSLETTTAYAPGEKSVAEDTREYAEHIDQGKVDDPRLFFFSRWADETRDISTDAGLVESIVEATGPARMAWTDVDSIVSSFREPNADVAYMRRVWLNQRVQSSEAAFDARRWAELADPTHVVADGSLIVLGFDGARREDSSALVATEVATGFQWPVEIWERDPTVEDWTVDEADVDRMVAATFERYEVWRMYADPPYWETAVARWQGLHGDKTVIEWWTNRNKPIAYALRAYREAMTEGSVSHDGDSRLAAHIGNARRYDLRMRDENAAPLWAIRKERSDSPKKIDAAMAGCLSWEAYRDAVASGAQKKKRSKKLVTF